MKVMIVGQMLNTNYASKLSGGIQTVERLHAKILSNQQEEVVFVAPADTEAFDSLIKIYPIDTLSEEGAKAGDRAEKSRLSKKRTAEIQEAITIEGPDLIINHSFSSSQVRLMAEVSKTIPVLNFIHNTPDTAMDIGIIAKAQNYLDLTNNGSAVVCVSEYQRDLWISALSKRAEKNTSFSFLTTTDVRRIYDKFCYPIYISEQEVKDPDGSFVTITRPDPVKNLHKLYELALKVEPFSLHTFMAYPGNIADCDYYANKLAPNGALLFDRALKSGAEFTLNINAERRFLLEALSEAQGCFIPCTVESAPVALLEAASYGVRSIVFAKEREGVVDHAALRLLSSDHVELINISKPIDEAALQLQKAIKKLSTDPGDRLKLRDFALGKHSFQNRIDNLMQLIKEVKSRYKTEKKRELIRY